LQTLELKRGHIAKSQLTPYHFERIRLWSGGCQEKDLLGFSDDRRV
jgi:hypothetical protein